MTKEDRERFETVVGHFSEHEEEDRRRHDQVVSKLADLDDRVSAHTATLNNGVKERLERVEAASERATSAIGELSGMVKVFLDSRPTREQITETRKAEARELSATAGKTITWIVLGLGAIVAASILLYFQVITPDDVIHGVDAVSP